MRLGGDLDLGLQEFPSDMARRAEVRRMKERIRRLRRRMERLRIRQKIFFLDTELESVIGRKDARLLPGRDQCPDAEDSLLRVEPEIHGFKFLVLNSWF
jgi:hypothetical protein